MAGSSSSPFSINTETLNVEVVTQSSPLLTHPGCPCQQNGNCKEQCCIETLRRQKDSSPGGSSNGSGQAGTGGPVAASYGSFEDVRMVCPVRETSSAEPDSLSIGSVDSNQPLLRVQSAQDDRDLVSGNSSKGYSCDALFFLFLCFLFFC